MIRLRTSTLEAFRRVIETDYTSEKELVERIERGQWADGPTKWQMRAGTAWHKVLADRDLCIDAPAILDKARVIMVRSLYNYLRNDPPDGAEDAATRELENLEGINYIECHGYEFTENSIAYAQKHIGPGLCEITGHRTWKVGNHLVEVEGTADHIRGLVIQDHKTTFSSPDPTHYESSLQWRLYLLIHGAACFRYNLFEFREPRARPGTDFIASPDETSCAVIPEQDGYCELKNILSFRMWPYSQMENDCLAWLGRFIDWASRRRLLHLLEVRMAA